MKKTVSFAVLILFCAGTWTAYADDIIKGPLPEKFPGPEKCAACHQIDKTSMELKQSGHADLKCLDCHIPGGVQRKRYESKDIAFERLGYHQQKGDWVETTGNKVCLRCHAEMGRKDTNEKCWSCHMLEDGTDKLIIVKDKKLPPGPDNIRRTKILPHKSHKFTIHGKIKLSDLKQP